MLFHELQKKKARITELADQYGARRIRVFGSVAREHENVNSDIDFLVDFPVGYDLFAQRLPLAEELEHLTGRTIDLLPEHELNAYLRPIILQEARDL